MEKQCFSHKINKFKTKDTLDMYLIFVWFWAKLIHRVHGVMVHVAVFDFDQFLLVTPAINRNKN